VAGFNSSRFNYAEFNVDAGTSVAVEIPTKSITTWPNEPSVKAEEHVAINLSHKSVSTKTYAAFVSEDKVISLPHNSAATKLYTPKFAIGINPLLSSANVSTNKYSGSLAIGKNIPLVRKFVNINAKSPSVYILPEILN